MLDMLPCVVEPGDVVLASLRAQLMAERLARADAMRVASNSSGAPSEGALQQQQQQQQQQKKKRRRQGCAPLITVVITRASLLCQQHMPTAGVTSLPLPRALGSTTNLGSTLL
jgi:hypothetical protein